MDKVQRYIVMDKVQRYVPLLSVGNLEPLFHIIGSDMNLFGSDMILFYLIFKVQEPTLILVVVLIIFGVKN